MTLVPALRLRWRVLRRTQLTPLTAFALAGLSALAALAGQALAGAPPAAAPFALSLLPLPLLLALAARADHLLHRAPELSLLLPAGLSPRQLARLRLLELLIAALLALVPVAGCLVGMLGRAAALPIALTLLALAPTLAGAALLLARAWRAAPLLAPLAAPAAAVGLLILPAARGDLASLAGLVGCALLSLLLGERLGPLGQARALDRAARRPDRARGGGRALAAALRPLGRPAAALLARDLLVFLRGGFPRGAVALACLPLGLLAARAAASDETLGRFEVLLAGLLVSGVLATGAGYLFGVDFPRARAPERELERVQPLRASAVVTSRLVPALLLGLLLLLGTAAALSSAPRLSLVDLLARGALLVLAVVHDAVVQGLQAEAAGDPAAGAAAFPLKSATLVVVLALGLAFHPAGILLYPLLWAGAARSAHRAWERSEVPPLRRAA